MKHDILKIGHLTSNGNIFLFLRCAQLQGFEEERLCQN